MAGLVTGPGGVAVAGRAFRGMRLPGACDANLGVLRRIAQGRTAGQAVETAVTGVMPGADNVEEIDRLRENPAAAKMPGYAPAYNVAAALRAAAVEPEERVARVKSLRFNLLPVSARLTRFSRKITLRFAGSRAWVDRILRLPDAFPCRVQPTG